MASLPTDNRYKGYLSPTRLLFRPIEFQWGCF